MKKNNDSVVKVIYSRREFIKLAVAGGLSATVFGCAQQSNPGPQIVYRPSRENVPVRPAVSTNTPSAGTAATYPAGWVPSPRVEKNWTAIIVHHSATQNGNSAIFNTAHLARGWDGVGYDFVIGNGTNSGNGEVEVTFRWTEQRVGAHVGGTPNNWANRDGIGICLVGDFNSSRPTERQLQSLVSLVNFLRRRYNIPIDSIYGHKNTPGAGITDCPGNNFPMSRFKSML